MMELVDWARYVARDGDGSLWQFSDAPQWRKVSPDEDDGMWCANVGTLIDPLDDAPEWDYISVGACVSVK